MILRVFSRISFSSALCCSIILMAALVLSGCGANNPYPPGTFDRAQFFLDEEEFTEAVPALEMFVRHNPTDSLAVQAQFLKGRTLMELEQYPLASVEFQILRKDYPTSPLTEDASFYEGVSYYEQVGNIERDVTGAYEARLHFLDFSQEFPNSKYMTEIVQYMQDISDIMVQKRLQQIKIYSQLKRYSAIAITLDTVLLDEPGSSLLDEVLWRRGEVAVKLEEFDEAESFFKRLINEYPTSDYAAKAQDSLRDLQDATSGES